MGYGRPNCGAGGPSGAGKTLTLQCIAGLETPDDGDITCAGVTLFDSPPHTNLRPQARRIGYVFQGYALFPHMTCGERGVLSKKEYGTFSDTPFGKSAVLFFGRSPFLDREARSHAAAVAVPSQLSGDSNSAWRSRARWPPIPICFS
jgi:ABC-type Fe3+/spermidine/putrescine transport system ATPase subunit